MKPLNALHQIPCTTLKGVGPRSAEYLAKLHIHSVQDLLFHLPYKYQDRTRITPIRCLRPGTCALIEGKIQSTKIVYKGRRQLVCYLEDGAGFLTLRFFHFSMSQERALKEGLSVRCFGEVRFGYDGFEMIHPECRYIDVDNPLPVETSLTPVYPSVEKFSQVNLRKIIGETLQYLNQDNGTQELLPQNISSQKNFPDLKTALLYLHCPPPDADINLLLSGEHAYQKRLAFEELLAHHLCLRKLRQSMKQHNAVALSSKNNLVEKFLSHLPFTLTKAQVRVSEEVFADMHQTHPMMRLVQGDVGSGKTIVAALAALLAVQNNCQVAFMAPTELLAEQHFKNFENWFDALNIEVAWLSSQVKGKKRQQTLELIANGKYQVIVGTHALFQADVHFDRLALMIVDEQHRFGVAQRLMLREKGRQANIHPHQLIMTATPIPRTLAMSVYADLDHSVIDEMPPGRKFIETVVLNHVRRQEIVDRIQSVCRSGHQVYWVCPLIEESDVLQCEAAEKTFEQLKNLLPGLNVALVHGRMKSREKEAIMSAFKDKTYDLLVATTVIEVGVDVPNANLMVIENAERLGLSQLHQLRGRVGRGAAQSYCVLLYQPPLSAMARSRLRIMRRTQDGFEIARKDLALRGPGEVLGTKQTGLANMKIADLIRDKALLPEVREAAAQILEQYSECVEPLIARWIGESADYGHV